MNKTTYILLGIGGAIVIAGVVTLIIVTRKPKTEGNTQLANEKELIEIKAKYPPTNAAFPLRKGSKGNNVINVNIALGLVPSDVFSSETESTLLKKFGKTEITQADYDYYAKLILK